MEKSGNIFHFNPFNLIIPGIFFGAAVFLREIPDLAIILYVVLGLGMLSTLVLLLSYQTLIITDSEIGIKKLWRSQVIPLEAIHSKIKKTMLSRGVEHITWTLFLKEGKKIVISNEPFRQADRLKEALNWFLRNVPAPDRE